jgi:hypothetical protein
MHALIVAALLGTAAPDVEPAAVVETPLRTWADGDDRWFAAARIDAGLLFLRPRFQLGWGKPHFRWFGIEANPLVSSSNLGIYSGVRLEWPDVDVRFGGRYQYSVERSFLVEQEEYDHLDIESRAGPSARYVSLEAQLTGEVPWGPGKVRFELTGTAILGVPDGYYVYEETLKVVAAPPWVYGGELGYLFTVGGARRLDLGPVVEIVILHGRRDFLVSGGLKASLKLWQHWEARATFQPPIISSDNLGLKGGDSFQLGLRYRWATD